MIEKDVEHRIELTNAIKHPWVTLEGSETPEGWDTVDESSGNDLELKVSKGASCGVGYRRFVHC